MEFNLKLQSLLGILVFIFIAWLISENRSLFDVKSIIFLVISQFLIAIFILFIPFSDKIFFIINELVLQVQNATEFGTSFVFGYLGGEKAPFLVSDDSKNYILAFRALPLIIVVSAISSLLFYLRILPTIIFFLGRCLGYISQISPVCAFGASANIFVGMVEAPLLIKPYIEKLSRSDLFAIMTTGMCTVAGTVFALYVSILDQSIPTIAGHLILSSVLSAFAGVMIAQIMIPPKKDSPKVKLNIRNHSHLNMVDALTSGTTSGLYICLNVTATLIVALSIVYLINNFLILFTPAGAEPLSLQLILGYLFAPLMWFTGLNWEESIVAGGLMGTKTILNEFIAFINLSQLNSNSLSERSQLITVYALSGFANFGSLGIMIAGLSAMTPNRRKEILELGPKSLVSGTLATLITASVIGVLT